MRIQPARALSGRVRVPGDKSISHRAAIISALAAQSVEIEGAGLHLPHAPRAASPLDCGNSGTTMRLLAGLLAGQRFDSTLDGDASLRTRPMRRIIEPLRLMGARIDADDEGRAPLRIEG